MWKSQHDFYMTVIVKRQALLQIYIIYVRYNVCMDRETKEFLSLFVELDCDS